AAADTAGGLIGPPAGTGRAVPGASLESARPDAAKWLGRGDRMAVGWTSGQSHQQVSWDASCTREHVVPRSILPYFAGCETPSQGTSSTGCGSEQVKRCGITCEPARGTGAPQHHRHTPGWVATVAAVGTSGGSSRSPTDEVRVVRVVAGFPTPHIPQGAVTTFCHFW